MNTILTIKDIKLITEFLNDINKLSEARIQDILSNLGDNFVLTATKSNDKITSLMTINIVKNNYYIGEFEYLEFNRDELTSLLNFTLDYLKNVEKGLNIFYDNYPFNRLYDEILRTCGFKYNIINYMNNPSYDKIEVFNSNFYINDKSHDVKDYLYKNYQITNHLYDEYLGIKSEEIMDINLDNTNTVSIRSTSNQIIGVARFGLVADRMFINSIYAEDQDTYHELFKIIKSLTSKQIEIAVLPVRMDLMEYLNHHEYLIVHADYLKGVEDHGNKNN